MNMTKKPAPPALNPKKEITLSPTSEITPEHIVKVYISVCCLQRFCPQNLLIISSHSNTKQYILLQHNTILK